MTVHWTKEPPIMEYPEAAVVQAVAAVPVQALQPVEHYVRVLALPVSMKYPVEAVVQVVVVVPVQTLQPVAQAVRTGGEAEVK